MATSDDDVDDPVCGSTDTIDDTPCQFPVSDPGDSCHMHDAGGPPEGHGSGDPDHSMGAGNGDIDEKVDQRMDKPALTHGIHAVQNDPQGTLQWLENNDSRGYEWVIGKWDSYLEDAPFDAASAKGDDLLHVCLMLYAVRGVRHQQITQGLVESRPLTDEDGNPIPDPETGEPFMIDEEHAANLPANRIATEARSLLKDLGVMDDPESKKAEAMGYGEAAKEVALEVDSEVDH